MKILILARGIPSQENPQEGCFEWDQAKALKALGHDVVVMSLDGRWRKGRQKFGITKTIKEGIETYKIYWLTISIIEHLISFKLACRIGNFLTLKLFKHIISRHPDIDILNAHFLKCIQRATYIKKKFSILVVGTEHWSELESDKLDWKVRYLGEKAYKQCDAIISVSESLRNRIFQHFGCESFVLHNMIGMEFEHTLSIKQQKREKFKFICTGSLIQRKGFDFLIEAFRQANISDKVEISIIGAGILKDKLETQISNSGLSSSVKLLGSRQKNEIINLLSESDAFILPSRAENFSVAVLEALSIGLPVIATICGGIKECIDSSNGILVPVDDIEAMKNALIDMVSSKDKFDRLKIREESLQKYGSTVIANKLVCIYKDVIARYRGNTLN